MRPGRTCEKLSLARICRLIHAQCTEAKGRPHVCRYLAGYAQTKAHADTMYTHRCEEAVTD